jgi:hypothetical protein
VIAKTDVVDRVPDVRVQLPEALFRVVRDHLNALLVIIREMDLHGGERIVHENVETAVVVAVDSFEQLDDLARIRVIYVDGDALAASLGDL